jgi:hypothetical protein
VSETEKIRIGSIHEGTQGNMDIHVFGDCGVDPGCTAYDTERMPGTGFESKWGSFTATA